FERKRNRRPLDSFRYRFTFLQQYYRRFSRRIRSIIGFERRRLIFFFLIKSKGFPILESLYFLYLNCNYLAHSNNCVHLSANQFSLEASFGAANNFEPNPTENTPACRQDLILSLVVSTPPVGINFNVGNNG